MTGAYIASRASVVQFSRALSEYARRSVQVARMLFRCSDPDVRSSNTRASASKHSRMGYSQSHQNDMVLRIRRR